MSSSRRNSIGTKMTAKQKEQMKIRNLRAEMRGMELYHKELIAILTKLPDQRSEAENSRLVSYLLVKLFFKARVQLLGKQGIQELHN